jgi:uncharacterized Zn-binding protein involved in type VI secretion
MFPAACLGDQVMQQAPHCHAPIHPPAPVPTPVPHPSIPMAIVLGNPTVLVGGKPLGMITSMSGPCTTGGCVPAGPPNVVKGSPKVLAGAMPAARIMDTTAHASCVAPIPSPTGMVMPPGFPTVLIG